MKKKRIFHPVQRVLISSETLESRRLLTSTINFAAAVNFSTGTTPVALVAADFNGDGNEGLAVADSITDKVYVYFGNGTGSFSAGPVLSLSSPPSTMITGDFNGDGKPDIAVACTAAPGQTTTSVDVFLNTGAGTFGLGQITTVETDAVAGEPVALAAEDFNGDAHLDLAVTDYTDQNVSILFGTGLGTFAAPVNYQMPGHPTAIAEADFGDGNSDLAVTNTFTDNSTGTTITTNNLSILLGSPSGTFSAGPNIQLDSSGIPYSVVTANLTGANTPGLIVGASDATATLFTNSSGTFAESAQASLAAGSTAIAVGDFDLDGNIDFVSADGGSSISTTTNSVTVVQGTGGGNIGNINSFMVGAEPADVVVADFNNDGKPDIATANAEGGTVSILLNDTALPLVGTKTALAVPSASTPAGSPVTITATITASSVSPLTNEELPTGTVNFYDGSTLLSSVTLTPGATQAVFSTDNLIIGKHNLRAVYSGDDAYAKSNSATLAETITPTATEGPDLIGTFVSSTLPAEVAPGESGNVSIRITNQGNFLASGSITNDLFLSLDTLLDSGDTPLVVHGSLARAHIHLEPNQSRILTGSIVIPQSTALASYYLLTSVNATASLAESVSTNNLAVSPTSYAVADVFGTVDGRKGVVLTVTDNSGTPATFRMTGAGNGTVNIGDDGVDLILDQTTAASSLTITTKGAAVFALHDLTADSAIGTIRAGVSVSDAITLPGGAATIAIGSVSNANLTSAAGIRSLSVTSWTGGQISVPWIGTLKSTRNFTAAMQLSGTGAPAGVSLNSATIGGSIGDAVWTIAGGTNKISAASFIAGWTLDETGPLKSISSAGAFPVTISATDIYTIQARGSAVGASITSTGLIRSIVITGPVDSTTHFSAAEFSKAVLGGVKVDPVTDSHFTTT